VESLNNAILAQGILSLSPNALTALNAMMGIISVLFAFQGRMRVAYFFIIGAVIFDTFDGILARKLGLSKTPSDRKKHVITIGAILDDFADGISFCIAPALMFYFLFNNSHDVEAIQQMPYGGAALLYTVMGIARLIYFIRDTNPIPGFFKGMPTPAAALLVSAPLIMFQQSLQMNADLIIFWGKFCFILIIISSVLMNLYPIHYIHVARSVRRRPMFYKILSLIILFFIFTPYFGYYSLFIMLLYTLSPLWTWRIQSKYQPKKQPEMKEKNSS